MEFNLKIQKIGEETEDRKSITLTHEFEPPSSQFELTRGKLFLVFSTSIDKDNFDLKAAVNLFIETVKENYYRATDDTPLHAIEKALTRALKMLLAVKSEDETLNLSSPEVKLELSFSSALIWNRVLYVSYYGNPAAYLIRGTGTRDLGLGNNPSEIWTNSSILDDEDLVIIGTSKFRESFDAQNIISNLGNLGQRASGNNKLAVILIKTSVSAKGGQNPTLLETIKNTNIRNSISNNLWKFKTRFLEKETLSDKFKVYQKKKAAPISSITSAVAAKAEPGTSATSAKRLIHKVKTKHKARRLVAGLLVLFLLGYFNYSFFSARTREEAASQMAPARSPLITGENSAAPAREEVRTPPTRRGETFLPSTVMGVQNIAPNFEKIIDISSFNSELNPAATVLRNEEQLYLIDAASETFYRLNTADNSPGHSNTKFAQARLLYCTQSPGGYICLIYGSEFVHAIYPNKPDEADEYKIEANRVLDISFYINKVYLLTDNNILQLTLQPDEEAKPWLAEEQNIENPVSFAIDGNIYVLANRNIHKYYNGQRREGFEVENEYLQNPLQIEVDEKYIYVLDETKKSIVIYDKSTGKFIKEVNLNLTNEFNSIASFTILKSDAGKSELFFRSENNVYKVTGELP